MNSDCVLVLLCNTCIDVSPELNLIKPGMFTGVVDLHGVKCVQETPGVCRQQDVMEWDTRILPTEKIC